MTLRRTVMWIALVGFAGIAATWAADGSDNEWWKQWTPENHGDQFQLGHFHGRDNVYWTCPKSRTVPFKWKRTVTLAKGKSSRLIFDISARQDDYAINDFLLQVNVDGHKALEKVIHGTDWQTITVDLAGGEGQTVQLELVDADGGKVHWHWETAYWSDVRIEPEPQK